MNAFAKFVAVVGLAVIAAAAIAGISILMAFPIKWTWNAVMPYLFSLPTLTWGKAWCVSFLCGSLLKPHNIGGSAK
jgi:hypothetical protein